LHLVGFAGVISTYWQVSGTELLDERDASRLVLDQYQVRSLSV
jgi:hypothetical protein